MKMKGMILTLLALVLVISGCAKEKKQVGPTAPVVDLPDGPYIPDGTGPGQGPGNFDGLTFEVGGTAPFTVDGGSLSQKNVLLSEYTGRSMNEHKNMRINANFTKVGSNWGGTVTTTYQENGFIYYWYFNSGSSAEAVKYNVWFKKNGQQVFHAVLEDFYIGSIVLTIDEVIDLGDGQGPEDLVNGSLWFKNHGFSTAPHPPTFCWFVYFAKGYTPYDCRPWPDGTSMNTYADVNPTYRSSDPTKGYKRLGRFTGLSLEEAFNGELNLK